MEDYVGRPDKISNAEIAAICQEAGMHAVRKNRYVILPKDFEKVPLMPKRQRSMSFGRDGSIPATFPNAVCFCRLWVTHGVVYTCDALRQCIALRCIAADLLGPLHRCSCFG